MNERILKIAGQNCVGEYHAGILCWRFSENQLRKFTELILEECCDQVREIDAMEIRKHFGITPKHHAASEWPREL